MIAKIIKGIAITGPIDFVDIIQPEKNPKNKYATKNFSKKIRPIEKLINEKKIDSARIVLENVV